MLRNQPVEPGLHRRMALARELFAAHGAALAADPQVARLLAEYHQAILRSHGLMRGEEAFAACADCAGEDGGASCCFQGAEEWYGELLLLINLLLGVELPGRGEGGQDCFFNSPQGCRLAARFAICLNFFCPQLGERLGEAKLLALRQAVGRELLAGEALEGALRRWLAARGVRASA